ncbi:ABC transporter permease subunit [Candidatus Liberibacter asiaticus]|uniref:ABC transporter membrane spanning protein (Amino acid) n=2 Tax=Liberibacter asiaticus TaxID=34021 RepID=C6XH99_LIBAP|nr:ABC transporter permease subunit [Candidatus Liberibacter asiaticus]ACT56644.1 ABC transporter membrane spanning protein (amino acid) [Candidatus Liberibacter asiaticus str. psy62]AGH16411.1 ABC transporter membrane spanning protein [Candidatus Liberibacter asiaticus str. gxpsy]ALK06826.1 ABC transporter permease subunit [Candidatus Liberibacter asiaticus]ASK52294.1 amino acid ABC transporter permease [Candidatus Liberibacter asiaticus]AWL13616.1 amino acid ABC transporter permease [Candida
MIKNARKTVTRYFSRMKFLYDMRVHNISVQIILALLLTVIFLWCVNNVYNNMEKSNLSLGIGFLSERAGFEIDQGIVPYTSDSSYATAILVGFVNTFWLAFSGMIPATIIGTLVGAGRLSANKLVAWICRVYVEVFRNIPPLVVIFFLYKSVLSVLPIPDHSIVLPFGMFLNNRGLSFPTLTMDTNAKIFVFSFVLGIVLSLFATRLSRHFHEKTGKALPLLYISTFLIFGLPTLVLIALKYQLHFDKPVLGQFNFIGGSTVSPEFMSLYIALSCYTAAFIAEIVRSGLIAVPRGQMEAAIALGLTHRKATRLVLLPQAMRSIIPPLTSQYLNLLKNSSLAVAVGFADLVSVGGTIINQTGQAIEIILIWMFIYLSLSIMIALFMNRLNAKIALKEKK